MGRPMIKCLRNGLVSLLFPVMACAGVSLNADVPEAVITSPTGTLKVNQYQEIHFTASSTDSVGYDQYSVNSYAWDFGNGVAGAGADTRYSYPVPGTYNLKLTVNYTVKACSRMDTAGNCTGWVTQTKTATAMRTIMVLPPPQIVSFTAVAPSVEVGKPVTLTWSTTNAITLTLTDVGDVTGRTSATVTPTSSTTGYILTAAGPNGVPVTAIIGVGTYNVGVSIGPSSAIIALGEQQTFTATVSPANQGVSWSATGGALGSEAGSGGTYTKTYTGSTSGSFTIQATSLEDSTRSASASVLVGVVTVGTPVAAPADARTYVGGTVSFNAVVSGAVNKAVTWSVSGGGLISPAGVFTANQQGTFTVTATSQANTTKSASATVMVLPLVVSVSPDKPSVTPGSTQAFTATVAGAGSPSQAVNWSVGTGNAGTITAGGIYTAPTIPGDYTVQATSIQDGTCIGTATVHVPGWVLKWKKGIVYVGTREIAEYDGNGMHVTLGDHLGSPRFLVNGSGTVEAEQKFLPFGEQLTDPVNAAKFAKGFTNHEQTDVTGLIYMQARFYAPWYGRFLSPDPKRDEHFEDTQGWNIYSYCQNNPIMKIDPDGMKDDWYMAPAERQALAPTKGGRASSGSSGPSGTVVWHGRVYNSSDLVVHAVNPGTVTDARVMRGYGPTVDIHPDGRPVNERDRSGHLSPNIPVTPGQHVEGGQEIGTVGIPPPGTTTGPHLHQEKIPDINNPKATVDPMPDAKRALPGSIPRDGVGPRTHPVTHKPQGNHTGQDLQPKWKPVPKKKEGTP